VKDSLYNVTVLYSGSDYEIYINGNLDAFSSWSGKLLQSKIALTIGQMLPTDNNYNFNGVLDDIRIYNYALSVSDIKNLADINTYVNDNKNSQIPDKNMLFQNYPNPFNPTTRINFWLKTYSNVTLTIYNMLGQKITDLINGYLPAGEHTITWNGANAASGIYFYELKTGEKRFYKKMVLLK